MSLDVPAGLTPELLDARTSTMDPPDAPSHPQDDFNPAAVLDLPTAATPIYDETKDGEQA